MSSRPAGWQEVGLDLSVIGEAFQLLMKRWQEYLLLGFLTVTVSFIFFVPGYFGLITLMMTMDSQPNLDAIVGLYGLMFGGLLVGMALAYPFMFGIVSFTIREVQSGDATLADAWRPLRRYGRYMFAGLALSVLQGVASIVGCGLGGIVAGGLLMYVMPIMVHEDLSLGDAIIESYARIKGQWLMASVVVLLASLVSSLGQVACGIGMLLTYPLLVMIPAIHYLKHLPVYRPTEPLGPGQSPYPRGQYGHVAAPTQPQEETPRPPMDEPPQG